MKATLAAQNYESSDGNFYLSENGEVRVLFEGDRVTGVAGTRLELGQVDYTPDPNDSDLSKELRDFLGDPDWKVGQEFDFSHEWGFDRYSLVLQAGCSGWYFFLGDPVR